MSKKQVDVKKGDIVMVEWFDAYRDGDAEVTSLADVEKVGCDLRDVGFFLGMNKEYLAISEESDQSSYFRHLHFIPLVNLKNLVVLKKNRQTKNV